MPNVSMAFFFYNITDTWNPENKTGQETGEGDQQTIKKINTGKENITVFFIPSTPFW